MNETINQASDAVIREIRHRVVLHIESHILKGLADKFHNLKFKISEELFASINSRLVSVIFAFLSTSWHHCRRKILNSDLYMVCRCQFYRLAKQNC